MLRWTYSKGKLGIKRKGERINKQVWNEVFHDNREWIYSTFNNIATLDKPLKWEWAGEKDALATAKFTQK